MGRIGVAQGHSGKQGARPRANAGARTQGREQGTLRKRRAYRTRRYAIRTGESTGDVQGVTEQESHAAHDEPQEDGKRENACLQEANKNADERGLQHEKVRQREHRRRARRQAT